MKKDSYQTKNVPEPPKINVRQTSQICVFPAAKTPAGGFYIRVT